MSATHRIICLMSAQLVPNYQLVKHLKLTHERQGEDTAQVLCIFTEATRAQADWFKLAVEKHLGVAVRVDASLYLDRPDHVEPAETMVSKLMHDLPNIRWTISCVGGTKMMAGGVLLAARSARAAGIEVRVLYVDIDNPDSCIDAFNGVKEPMSGEMALAEYLDLFGIPMQEPPSRHHGERRWEAFCIAWCARDPRVLPLKLAADAGQRQQQLHHWRREGMEDSAQVPWSPALDPALRDQAQALLGKSVRNWEMRLLTGDLLDNFIYVALADYASQLGITEVRRWVRAEAIGEVDLCVVRGGELILIECKAGRQPSENVLAQIAKLDFRRQRIGAKKSRVMLVSSGENLFTNPGDKAWHPDVRQAAKRGSVQVIGRPQLMALARTMQEQRHQDAIVQLNEWLDGPLPELH